MSIIAHGIDAVDIKKFTRLSKTGGAEFLKRCFSDRELTELSKERKEEHFASAFAAKEAVLKALGTGFSCGAKFVDIEIYHKPSGAPYLVLSGQCESIANQLGITNWLISITHIKSLSIASVIGTNDI